MNKWMNILNNFTSEIWSNFSIIETYDTELHENVICNYIVTIFLIQGWIWYESYNKLLYILQNNSEHYMHTKNNSKTVW